MAEKLLYRLSEAADAIGVSRSVLYDLINSGEIAAIRVKSDLRIPVAALRAWVATHPPAPVPIPPRPRRKRKK